MSYIYHNGSWRADHEAVLTIQDRALRGDGIFDTMLAVDGKLCHGPAHFERLLRHAEVFDLDFLPSQGGLIKIAEELLHKNAFIKGHYALVTTITRGPGARGLALPVDPQPQLVMRASSAPQICAPLHVIIAESTRRNEHSPLTQIKSLNYGDNILARNEAHKAGADEAIMLNTAGNAACLTTGNLFLARSGKLYTPPLTDGAMDGIARGLILSAYNGQEATLTPADLFEADGVFVSNSLRGLQPILSIDKKALPQTDPESDLQIPKTFHLS